ncbi:c-type cytochrome [Roseateles violae]|uniref:C-type cytochrome n=1 Tax=Roseateles violae TaxID=3058042 RepID=A0ABT8DWG2_9BURK|nr:c-type cytochrome [Pelomonas sp. PFR6]MDN3922446.1 c-type cytochrome [Pelomonas sp. PFR6]
MSKLFRSQALFIVSALACAAPSWAVDASAAQALARKSDCLKCHAVDKAKTGPSFKDVAAKYKGQADAEQKIVTHLTTGPKVKIDGKEETHPNLKSASEAEIKNVAQWILSR